MIGPSLSVVHTVPSCRKKLAPAVSSPPKQHETVEQPRHEPLESHGNLSQSATQPLDHLVDHAAAHQGLADRGVPRPKRSVHEQVPDAPDFGTHFS
jgi:hypothetical protein